MCSRFTNKIMRLNAFSNLRFASGEIFEYKNRDKLL
jgi:hypothetical protein